MIDHKPIGVRRLICATEGCGFQGEIIDRTNDGLPSAVVRCKFEQKGWDVGNNEKHDFCPRCVDARRAERRARRFKPVIVPKGETAPMPSPTQSNAEAPPEMTRADKRLIFAKLEEVYVDETSGYKTPWTDAAVAKDMAVPLAWVIAIREENFGPAADNSEIRDMLLRVKAAATEANTVLAQAKSIRTDGAALVDRVNKLSHECVEIGKKLDGLLILADRIERATKA